jgi:hypothetical protein
MKQHVVAEAHLVFRQNEQLICLEGCASRATAFPGIGVFMKPISGALSAPVSSRMPNTQITP